MLIIVIRAKHPDSLLHNNQGEGPHPVDVSWSEYDCEAVNCSAVNTVLKSWLIEPSASDLNEMKVTSGLNS